MSGTRFLWLVFAAALALSCKNAKYCSPDAGCPGGSYCDPTTHACVTDGGAGGMGGGGGAGGGGGHAGGGGARCDASSQCANGGAGSACEIDGGKCVECLTGS